MAGIAQLARDSGFQVTGCDQNVYPPMSTLLDELGIPVLQGYLPEHVDDSVDQVVIGNALSRGNELVEHVLSADVRYTSGPQWLHDHFLFGRRVLAVAGTHARLQRPRYWRGSWNALIWSQAFSLAAGRVTSTTPHERGQGSIL